MIILLLRNFGLFITKYHEKVTQFMYFSGINLGQESAIQATTFFSVHLIIDRIGKLLEIALKTIG